MQRGVKPRLLVGRVLIHDSHRTRILHRWAQSAMDRWIDTDTIDRCYRSILLVMLTSDSIDPSIKDFFFLIDSIDHRSQNPYKTDDHRSIGSISTDGIDLSVRNRFSYHHFPERKRTLGRSKYYGLKGRCQKICCELLKRKTEVFSSIKSCLEYED